MRSVAVMMTRAALFMLIAVTGSAQQSVEAEAEAVAEELELTAEQAAQLASMQAFLDELSPQSGSITIGDNLATLTVPETFHYYGPEDARAILVDAWGNPPENGESLLGMLMPAQYTAFDIEGWAVTIEYSADGYVSDDDAASIDYDDLLDDMKSSTRQNNEYLRENGYQTVELVGWAEPPHYDSSTHKMYWAKELMFEGEDETTLNYDIRALGRRGVLSMTFIASTSQLPEINASRETVLAMAEFTEGNRYRDFDPSIDKVAAYGIGALVGGKLAAKAGLFTAALLLLKKFWVFILIGFAAVGRWLMGMLRGGSAKADTNAPQS